MTRGRFQPVQTFERNGFRIAQVRDTKGGRDCFVYRPEHYLLHWDREDRPVRLRHLQEVGDQMLKAGPQPVRER